MDRREKLLGRIDKSMKVLEIGPSFSPILPKADGWNVWAVDHADQAGLRAKYQPDPTVDIDRIGPVDFVWTSGGLDAAVPVEHHGSFDACIASHVIEHLPEPVGFYKALETLIRPGGVVALAVPDKRFCFDYFRPLSVTSEFIVAHLQHRRRHSSKTAFDHMAYTVSSGGSAGWGQQPVGDLSFSSTLAAAYAALEATDEADAAPYVDYHAWCYTPNSFKLAMLELNVLGLLNWVVDVDYPADGCEFIVVLKQGRAEFSSELALQGVRKALLQGILADLAVQHDFMIPDTDAVTGQPAVAAPVRGSVAQRLTALETQHQAFAERLQVQERRLAKIWQSAKMTKRLLRPVRAVKNALRSARARLG